MRGRSIYLMDREIPSNLRHRSADLAMLLLREKGTSLLNNREFLRPSLHRTIEVVLCGALYTVGF
jgi:hypothetical protein